MTLTDHLPRLLAGIAFGAAVLVPAIAAGPAASADPGDSVTTPTIDPCKTGDALGPCPPPPPPPCPEGEIPIPIPGPGGGVKGVTCVPCENLPETSPGSCKTPECDPETEDCEPPEECDPETEDCDDPVPGDDHDPRPVPDRPVVARPTFTG